MKIEIIAEMAQGFEGKFNQAKLLRSAAASVANAAKFQLVYADELATPDYEFYDFFKSLEMNDEEWVSLKNIQMKTNKAYLDVFGTKSLDLCEKVDIKTIKLHPTDINNLSLLQSISASKIENIILGVGGASLDEIEYALNFLDRKK